MFFARQKMFHGKWSPVKCQNDPRQSMPAKAGTQKYKDVLLIPETAAGFSLKQLDQIMPGGAFYAVWRNALAAATPKASLPAVPDTAQLPAPE